MPVVFDGSYEHLNPDFFTGILEFSESAGDASEWVDLEVLEGFDWQEFFLSQDDFRGVSDTMLALVGDVILVGDVNLDLRVLSINLPLDEVLESFWGPDLELDAAANRGDFETEVLLVAAIGL